MSNETTELSIYDKRRDCLERWHLGDPAAALDMAREIERLRRREDMLWNYLDEAAAKAAVQDMKEAGL